MRWLVWIGILVAAPARADDAADVTAAFTAFVANATSPKPALTGGELFITPDQGTVPIPTDLAVVRGLLPTPKLSNTTAIVSPGGASAWIATDVAARVKRDDKPAAATLRASAVLVKDAAGWHVRAAHWSIGKPAAVSTGCGNVDVWEGFTPSVPAELAAPVKTVWDALAFSLDGPPSFPSVISDDKRAVMFGSAPGERVVGGAAIKSLFKRYRIAQWNGHDDNGRDYDANTVWARAGKTPDGALLWVAMPILAEARNCTYYRALFVLAHEASGWKIVHQHYSESYF